MNYRFIKRQKPTRDDELCHYGVKGMRWGVRKDKNGFVLKKGTNFYRQSNKKEKSIRPGAYVSYTKADRREYILDAISNQLGFKKHSDLYEIKISNLDPVKVRKGKEVLKDTIADIGDKSLKEAFDMLDKELYYDTKDLYKRYEIWSKNDKTMAARATLGTGLHNYIKKNKQTVLDKYKKMGYDAIEDPEDLTWNYESPLMITNPSKFKITETEKIKPKSKKKKST